jgi:hypothetical protein
MTKAGRLQLGLLVGLLLAIFVQPNTRELLLQGLTFGPSSVISHSTLLPNNFTKLPKPDTAETARMWLEVGAERYKTRQTTVNELISLYKLAATYAEQDPGNAFWHQMEAVFRKAAGHPGYLEPWKKAASCSYWSDPQDKVLLDTVQELGGDNPQAWQWAVVLSMRSQQTSSAIETFARELTRETPISKETLPLRMITLRNGDLIRKGSRRVANGESGINVAETASFPHDVPPLTSPRRLVLARNDFLVALKAANMPADADLALSIFRANDGFSALVSGGTASTRVRDLTIYALLLTCLPGAFIASMIAGGITWLIALAMEKLKIQNPKVWIIVPVAILLAGAAYFVSQIPFAGLGVGLSILSLLIPIRQVRKGGSANLPPGTLMIVQLLGITLSCMFALFVSGISTPWWELAQLNQLPIEYYGDSSIMLGLCLLIGCLPILTSFLLANVYRVPTLSMLAEVLKAVGRTIALTSVVTIVIGIVPATLAERIVRKDLMEMVLNEPLHILDH